MKIAIILFVISSWLWGAVQVDEHINPARVGGEKVVKTQDVRTARSNQST